MRAVFGFPLRAGTVHLGALNLYRVLPGPLTGEQHADALVVADVSPRPSTLTSSRLGRDCPDGKGSQTSAWA